MKDIVQNRRHISLANKLRLAALSFRQNGLAWTCLMGVYGVASAVANRAYAGMLHLRNTKGVPGMNSREMNQAIWETWNWESGGEEWTPSEAWKTSLIERILIPGIPANSAVVEIGPGGGRWTGELLKRASSYLGLDISSSCVDVCREKFKGDPRATFALTDGRSLPGVADGSVDVVWSFDVFVHINEVDVRRYLQEIHRVLRPGGRAILHHGSVGGGHGGWRSDLTTESLNAAVQECGLKRVSQVKGWDEGGVFHPAGLYEDLITTVEKPGHA